MALHVMDEANQCLGCKKPRCQQGCPIQTNIPEVIRLLKANKLDEAGRMLPERCLSRKAGIVRCCLKPIPCHGMRWNGVSCTSAGINCVPRMAFRRGTQLGCI